MGNIKLKYVGKGVFIAGIPARDLTQDEVNSFGGEEYLIGTGLYELEATENDSAEKSGKKKLAKE